MSIPAVDIDTGGTLTREQRIEVRKQRVAEKREALRRKEEGQDAAGGPKEKELGLAKTTVIRALKTIAQKRAETDAEVNDFKIACMERERARREKEEQRRQEIRAKMLDEAEQSAKANAEVAQHWSELFHIEVPQDLWRAIQEQQGACSEIIASKDDLIKEMKAELKLKDDAYSMLQRQQTSEIDALIDAMARQFNVMALTYGTESHEIDKAYLREQDELIKANMEETKALLDHRYNQEEKFQKRMEDTLERYHEELESTRVHAAEEYNQLKVRLTQDILNLERHMQAMAATFQLNQEKLDYNHRVLSEREHENSKTRARQKQKKHRQIDILSNLKQRYAELDKTFQEENMKLTDKYKEITELFKDLQHKYKHFEEADWKVYQEVFAHNDQLVAELVRKVLEADKIIHEQQLGLGWREPSKSIYKSPWEGVAEEAEEAADTQGAENEEREAAREIAERLRDPQYSGMLSMLINEAGFLVESRARAEIERVPGDEQGRRMIKHILDSLGVMNGELFDRLVQALVARVPGAAARGRTVGKTQGMSTKQPSTNSRAGSPTSSNSKGDLNDAALELVHPDDVVVALKHFVEKHGNDARNIKAKPGAASRVQVMTKRMMEREREYWHTMGNVVSEKGVKVWQALERALARYLSLLKKRDGDLKAVESMQEQNKELRALLGQYLSSKVNEELQLPPAHIL